jgi:hypothetical protein
MSMRKPLLLTMVLLTGCAHAPPPPPPAVDFSQMHCTGAADLTGATALAFDPKNEKMTAAVLDAQAGCMDSANGVHTLYKVFELPQDTAPYIIRITAAPWGDTILAPRAAFLDEKGATKRTTAHNDFTFRGNSLVSLLRNHADEKYLVVSSDPEALGNSVSRINENVNVQAMAAGPVFFTMYTGSDTATNLTLSAAGNVNVTITPLPAK